MATVERKIYFYRADVGTDERGQPIPFDPAPALHRIGQLPFSAGTGRYMDHGDGRHLCCWIDRLGQQPRFRFGCIRRSGLPMVERSGSLSELGIPPDSGLLEPVHVVVFGGNIVGSDFNHFGPRMSGLSRYLADRGNGLCPNVTFERLLRRDAEEQLRRFGELRLFRLRIRPSFIRVMEEASEDLSAALRAAHGVGEAEEVELILRAGRSRKSVLSRNMLRIVRFLSRREETQSEASKFEVAGVNPVTGLVEHLDLLQEQLIVRKQIVRQTDRGRALDAQSAFQAIEEAYAEVEAEVAEAAGVALS